MRCHLHYTGSLLMRLGYELVHANGVCPGIHMVRVGPATRSAVATCIIIIIIIIASGNRTPGSRFYSDLLDTWADSVCIHQLVLKHCSKAPDCSYTCNSKWLTCDPFQLMHVTWWPRCSIDEVWASHGGQNECKTLLQQSQPCHKGNFQHVSISARQRSLRYGQHLRRPFLGATLPMTVGSCVQAMADNTETKGLIITPPSWVSAHYTFVSLHDSNHDGVVNLCSFSSELWGYFIIIKWQPHSW